MRSLFLSHIVDRWLKLLCVLSACAVIVVTICIFLPSFAHAAWDGTPYDPEETLDPECSPDDPNCSIDRSSAPSTLMLDDDQADTMAQFGTWDTDGLTVGIGSLESFRIAPSGEVSMGTTSVAAQLTVDGGIATDALILNGSFVSRVDGQGLILSGGTLSLDTTGDWEGTFGGYTPEYFLENSFSTTSADYWLSQQPGWNDSVFATSAANAWFSEKTTDDLAEGLTNLYYTDARARDAISSLVPGLTYDNVAGILSLTNGYSIPLTASTTNWNAFYDTPSSRITAGTNLSWNGNTLNGPSDAYVRGLFSATAPLSYNAATGAFSFSTTSISGNGSGLNSDYLDGLDSSYFLTHSFSTTSADTWLGTKNTDALAEGSTNLYFTTARFDAGFSGKTTTDLVEGTNLYYTDARARESISSAVSGLDYSSSTGIFSLASGYVIPRTASTSEWQTAYDMRITSASAPLSISNGTISIDDAGADGATKGAAAFGASDFNAAAGLVTLDYANAQKANASQPGFLSAADWTAFNAKENALTVTYPLVRSGSTISLAFSTTTDNTWSGVNTFTGPVSLQSLSIGNLSGILVGNAGAVSATSSIGVLQGGLGLTNAPSYGQIPVGNGAGGYTLVATSSLGLNGTGGTVTSVGLSAPAGFSVSGSPVTGSGTLALSFAPGYALPLIASTTNWNTFYDTPSSRITAGTNLAWNGNTLNGPSDAYVRGLFSASTPLAYDAATGAFSFSTSSISGSESGLNADLLDGLDSSYLRANSFSTTSANYWLTTKSTSDVAEGANLYFTVARARGSVSAGTGLSYDSGTGAFSLNAAGDWSGTFDGREGIQYLDRANHTGTQTASTISDFTTAARGAFSTTVPGLTYTSSTGVLSLTNGYSIPLTASTTNWNTFYDTPSSRITAGTNLAWNGNTLNGISNTAIRGLFSATSPLAYDAATGIFSLGTVGVGNGGIGLTTAPSTGQLLIGNGGGGYSLVATSTLGFSLSNLPGTLSVSQGGTGTTSFAPGWIYSLGGSGALAASSSPTVGWITATSTTTPSTFGLVRIGNPASYPDAPLSIQGTTNSYLQVNIQNTSNGNAASSDYIATADNGNDSRYFIDMGINGSGYNQAAFNVGGANAGYLYTSDGSLTIGTASTTNAAAALIFHTGGTTAARERMRITQAGFVGIGTSAPTSALDVNGTVTLESNKNCSGGLSALGTDSQGRITCYVLSLSDARLKKDVAPLDDAQGLDLINRLAPVSYNWKDPQVYGNTDVLQFGFIAQDAETVAPNLVGTTTATGLTRGGSHYFNYIGLIAPLVKSVQELSAKLEEMRDRFVTKELCLEEVCITKDQLRTILERSGETSARRTPAPAEHAETPSEPAVQPEEIENPPLPSADQESVSSQEPSVPESPEDTAQPIGE